MNCSTETNHTDCSFGASPVLPSSIPSPSEPEMSPEPPTPPPPPPPGFNLPTLGPCDGRGDLPLKVSGYPSMDEPGFATNREACQADASEGGLEGYALFCTNSAGKVSLVCSSREPRYLCQKEEYPTKEGDTYFCKRGYLEPCFDLDAPRPRTTSMSCIW